jgi:RecB family exonuclease
MEQINKILKLSASRVDTYDKCHRKYYYTYLEKLPRKDWDHFDLGTLVHGTLENFHNTFRNDEQRPAKIREHMKNCFRKQHDIMQREKFIKPEVVKEAKDLLLNYLRKIEDKGIVSNICEIEKNFVLHLGECDVFGKQVSVEIQGFIDRLDKDPDGTWHIKDYKTSKSIKHMKPFQLMTYGIPLLYLNPDVDKFKGSYIMMRHEGMLLSYDFNREDVEKIKRELVEKAQIILTDQKWLQNPSPLCDWCDFKQLCFNSW